MTTLELDVSTDFVENIKRRVRKEGMADEVIIVALRPGERVLLHTKAFYPEGVYRLPSGKMKRDEQPDEAFYREFREELGQEGEIKDRLSPLHMRLRSGDDTVEMASHIFIAEETSAEPMPQDTDEEITGFIEVPYAELSAVAEHLRGLRDRWNDWGRFRAPAHDIVAEYLRSVRED